MCELFRQLISYTHIHTHMREREGGGRGERALFRILEALKSSLSGLDWLLSRHPKEHSPEEFFFPYTINLLASFRGLELFFSGYHTILFVAFMAHIF